MSAPEAPPPLLEADERSAPFFAAAARGRLLLQRCEALRRLALPPAPALLRLRRHALAFAEACGRGVVHSHARAHRAPHPALRVRSSRSRLVVVDLDEGVRVMARLAEGAPAVRVGTPVRVEFESVGETSRFRSSADLTVASRARGARCEAAPAAACAASARRVEQPPVALAARLGDAEQPQVLEVREGLAVRHRSPAARLEEPLREGLDRREPELAADRLHALEALDVVLLDRAAAIAEVVEGMAVGRQHLRAPAGSSATRSRDSK